MDPIILIFVAIVAVCVGFILGFLARVLTHQGSDTKDMKAGPKSKGKKTLHRSWIEVANLWRDRRDGRLIFQIEDKHYKRGDELTKRERAILLKVVMDFYRWLEPPSSEQAKNAGGNIQNIPDRDSAPGTPASETNQEVSIEELTTAEPEVQLSSSMIRSAFINANVATPETQAPSMVAQVDRILQDKLEAANMQKWAVRLTEVPNHGMVVWVGMERYEWLDEVPYKRVRDIIRESVAEWERRTETDDTSS